MEKQVIMLERKNALIAVIQILNGENFLGNPKQSLEKEVINKKV